MFIYLDTETTGSGSEDRLCQIAFKTEDGTTVDELFNPDMSISSTDLDEDLDFTVRRYLSGASTGPEYDASI